jgi:LPXTG-motif cell wall-anchored protein
VTIPSALAAGDHRVVLVDPATGDIAGWAAVTLDRGLATTGGGSPIWLPITAGALTVVALGFFVYARRQRERQSA